MCAACGSIQAPIEQIRSPPCAFLVDPFADVGRTVSELDAIRFGHGEQVHGIAVNQVDLIKIDGEEPALLIDCDTSDLAVVSCNPAENLEDVERPLSQHAVDSARHVRCALLFACPLQKSDEACSRSSRLRSANRPPLQTLKKRNKFGPRQPQWR